MFDSSDQDFIDNNLLKVEVFFSEFTYEDIAESPGYPVCACSLFHELCNQKLIIFSKFWQQNVVP